MILFRFLALGGVHFAFGKVQFMGMNIAGFEFGCQIDGTCPLSSISPPLTALGGGDGVGQMRHFVTDDQMNVFRLPVSWQFLVNNQVGAILDATNFGKYDQLMQACLQTGAYCAIDIHNFARFNGQIIGQGGPTDTQFADLWAQLATKYSTSIKVIFGLMNEPHDLDVPTWANSVQAAVMAIRNAGASSQMILLPGTNFTSAGAFVSSGSGTALIGVTNPDGSSTGLILDVHKYLDVDNSGTHTECTTDNIADAFQLVADFLRQNRRQAMVSETGAGSTPSCFTDFCAQNTFINQNSDVFLGYIAWAAGSFSTSDTLSLTPTEEDGKYVDNALASQCVISPWLNAPAVTITASASLTGAVGSVAASATGASTTSTGTSMVEGKGTGSSGSTQTTKTLTGTSGIKSSSGTAAVTGAPKSTGIQTGSSPAGLKSSEAEVTRFGNGLILGSILFAVVFY